MNSGREPPSRRARQIASEHEIWGEEAVLIPSLACSSYNCYPQIYLQPCCTDLPQAVEGKHRNIYAFVFYIVSNSPFLFFPFHPCSFIYLFLPPSTIRTKFAFEKAQAPYCFHESRCQETSRPWRLFGVLTVNMTLSLKIRPTTVIHGRRVKNRVKAKRSEVSSGMCNFCLSHACNQRRGLPVAARISIQSYVGSRHFFIVRDLGTEPANSFNQPQRP